jgi:hypothetical protein
MNLKKTDAAMPLAIDWLLSFLDFEEIQAAGQNNPSLFPQFQYYLFCYNYFPNLTLGVARPPNSLTS